MRLTCHLYTLNVHKKRSRMPAATCTQLLSFVNKHLELERTGGSVFVRDDNTVIITDKFCLKNVHIKLLERTFPHICVDVVSSASSRSGFLVILSGAHAYNRVWERSFLRLALHSAFFASTVFWTFSSRFAVS